MELSPELITRLRETLLRYGPFENMDELRALFAVDPRISPWRYKVPAAAKAEALVNLLVAELHEQENEQGENALALLLRVLAEAAPEGTAGRKALAALADELAGGEARPSSEADLYMHLETTEKSGAQAKNSPILHQRSLGYLRHPIWVGRCSLHLARSNSHLPSPQQGASSRRHPTGRIAPLSFDLSGLLSYALEPACQPTPLRSRQSA